MLSFIRKYQEKIFGKRTRKENNIIAGKLSERFQEIFEENYSSEIKEEKLVVKINKKNLFVWADDIEHEYRNFILEYSFSTAKINGHSSAGFLIKKNEESDYYYFLISNKGYFRFDRVFNFTPEILIPWTECGKYLKEKNKVKVISYESRFVFLLNDVFIAEINDDQIEQGGLAFAAQNYNEKDFAEFELLSSKINTNEIEAEEALSDSLSGQIKPEIFINLGDSFFSIGRYNMAAIQFRKGLALNNNHILSFKLAESCFNLKLFDLALENYKKAFEANKQQDYAEKIASCLYALKEYIELKKFLSDIISEYENNGLLWNYYGNAEYNLGNHESSLEKYLKAVECDSENADYSLNAAENMYKLGKKKKSLKYFIEAARSFFKRDDYSEIISIYEIVNTIDPDNIEVKALYGKILFHEGRYPEAEKLFAELIKSRSKDSAVYYLKALIESMLGNKKEALKHFKKASSLEPEYSLYLFRYAETAFLLGQDIKKEIKKCLVSSPDDIWVLNLAGQYYQSVDELNKAQEFFEKAHNLAPDEVDIRINYADLMFKTNKITEAFGLLDKDSEDWKVLNMLGILYSKTGSDEKAVSFFEKALSLSPENLEIMENLSSSASACLMYTRAEELALKVLEKKPSPELYNNIGNIAFEKGEYNRAEAAYNEAVKIDDNNPVYKLNLAQLYFSRQKYDESKNLAQKVLEQEDNERAKKILNAIENQLYERIYCSSCSLEWKVPKALEAQAGLRISGEPPGEAPAGKCPECGKILCINCAKEFLKDKRFICPDCKVNLKMSDNSLKYLLHKYLKAELKK